MFVSSTTHFFYVEQPALPFQKTATAKISSEASVDGCIPCMLTLPSTVVQGKQERPQPNHTLWIHTGGENGNTFVLQGGAYPLRRTRHQMWNRLKSLGGLESVAARSTDTLDLSVAEFLVGNVAPRLTSLWNTPASLIEQGYPANSGPSVAFLLENVFSLVTDTAHFFKQTVTNRVINIVAAVDAPSAVRSSATRDAIAAHDKKGSELLVLASRLKALKWTSRVGGTFDVVIRVAFQHDGKLFAVTLQLAGNLNFEPGRRPESKKEGRIEWVSAGGIRQKVSALASIELGEGSLRFVAVSEKEDVAAPRCIGYRALVTSSSFVTITTIWETSNGPTHLDVVLRKEDAGTSGSKSFQPHGYQVAAVSTCERGLFFPDNIEPFTLPYMRLTSSGGEGCGVDAYLGLQLGGIGSHASDLGELASLQYQFDEVVDTSGSWAASIASFFISGPSLNYMSTSQFSQVSGSVVMLVVVSLVKFGPRAYLHYRGVDTKKVRDQYKTGQLPTDGHLPMREGGTMTKEQREELLKTQRAIIAQMKAEDAKKKK